MQILIATGKSGNQATKTYDRICFEIFALLFLLGSCTVEVSFHAYVNRHQNSPLECK